MNTWIEFRNGITCDNCICRDLMMVNLVNRVADLESKLCLERKRTKTLNAHKELLESAVRLHTFWGCYSKQTICE